MAAVRTATVTWTGDLNSGRGTVSAGTSGLFTDLPVSWGSRIEAPNERTSPEELLAAAHASCFAMAFSGALARAGMTPEHLHVEAVVTFDRVDEKWTVRSSHLIVVGHAANASEAEFVAIAQDAKDSCPISRALAGNVEISVEPTLES